MTAVTRTVPLSTVAQSTRSSRPPTLRRVEWLEALAVVGAGLGAGIVVTAIGAGSLVSFPILLAVGLSPLVANVSNTVGLVPGNISGTWGYRSEMAAYPHLVTRVAATTALGALVGGWLLLAFPPDAFAAVVPYLVLFASTLVGVQPLVSALVRRRAERRGQRRLDAGRGAPRFLAALIEREQDRELVAADPRQRVARAQRALQPPRNGDQQLVPGERAEARIDAVETVEIDHQHRAARLRRRIALDQFLEPIGEARAIGQPGQAVGQHLAAQAVLGADLGGLVD